jgi:hypothetical protein
MSAFVIKQKLKTFALSQVETTECVLVTRVTVIMFLLFNMKCFFGLGINQNSAGEESSEGRTVLVLQRSTKHSIAFHTSEDPK